MKGVVVVDANLLLLLVVGAASNEYISRHKRLSGYSEYDFEVLSLLIAEFSDLILVPHVATEVSNLAPQIANPARNAIVARLRTLISTTVEFPVQSIVGAQADEFIELGLTDAVLRHLCALSIQGANPTLITADSRLADRANALGCSVIDYKREFQTGR